MLNRISLIIEILSAFCCVHCIHGKKVKINIRIIIAFFGLLVVLDWSNRLKIDELNRLVIYVLLYLYCGWEFQEGYIRTGINILILIIVLAAIQFVYILLLTIFIFDNEVLRTFIANLATLCMCNLLLPKLRLDKLLENIDWKDKYVKLLFGFILLVVIVLLLQDIVLGEIYAEFFVFSIPAVFLLLVILGKWSNTQIEVRNLEQELRINKETQNNYDDLLIKVRMSQHELKNHLAAIFSAHYTYDTYEKLVWAQKDYCSKLEQENKYNSLLLIGDNVLAGFLYKKFRDAEADGVSIEYKISSQIEKSKIPVFHLVEMLGILLDNAVEAVREAIDKGIFFGVFEEDEKYKFIIRNKNSYVPYSEIEKWFVLGKTTKGGNRGIGLYHVKRLCDEMDCNIGCRNVAINEQNWIEFILEIDKAGS